jgi:hypothetical protein
MDLYLSGYSPVLGAFTIQFNQDIIQVCRLFYSNDRLEPIHIHVEKGSAYAKVWVSPIRLQYSRSFNNTQINKILGLVEQNNEIITEAWNEFFND